MKPLATDLEPGLKLGTARLVIAAAGVLAMSPLYVRLWYWDLIAHFVGGVALYLLVSGFTPRRWPAVVAVAVLAGGWEFVEPSIPLFADLSGELVDSASDFVLSTLGALVGFVIAVAIDGFE